MSPRSALTGEPGAVGRVAPSPGRTTAVRLRPRALAALVVASLTGVAGFTWPLLVGPASGLAHRDDAPWLFAVLVALLLAVVLAEIADGGLDAKAVALLGVLAAVGAVLRPISPGIAGLETVFFLLILGGRALGPGFGFVLGALTLFTSALLTGGVGPWLPFQMLGAAWVGLLAGCLPAARGRAEVALLAGYGAVAGLLYGLLLNLSFWPFAVGTDSGLSFVPGAALLENLRRFVAFDLATSLGWDIPRALTNAALVAVTARPVLGAIRRAARRAAFEAPVRFAPPSEPLSKGPR